jgi:hypothetical protein
VEWAPPLDSRLLADAGETVRPRRAANAQRDLRAAAVVGDVLAGGPVIYTTFLADVSAAEQETPASASGQRMTAVAAR